MNPFDFINDLSYNKKDLIRSAEDPNSAEKMYNAYMINRGFSYFTDTILYANEMNKCSNLDNIMQNDYYLNSLRAKKRFSKWHKTIQDEDAQIISEAYNINILKAKEYLKLLSKENIDEIRKIITKGGKE